MISMVQLQNAVNAAGYELGGREVTTILAMSVTEKGTINITLSAKDFTTIVATTSRLVRESYDYCEGCYEYTIPGPPRCMYHAYVDTPKHDWVKEVS